VNFAFVAEFAGILFTDCVLTGRYRDEKAAGAAAAQDRGGGAGVRRVPTYAQAPLH
jgi:hypothetical protein